MGSTGEIKVMSFNVLLLSSPLECGASSSLLDREWVEVESLVQAVVDALHHRLRVATQRVVLGQLLLHVLRDLEKRLL